MYIWVTVATTSPMEVWLQMITEPVPSSDTRCSGRSTLHLHMILEKTKRMRMITA